VANKSLKDHAVAGSLNRLEELLNDPSLQAAEVAANETSQFHRDKLQHVVKSLKSLINQSPATLVSEVALNQLNANLQQPIAELTSFISNKNAGHLANAVSHVDSNVFNYTWAFIPKANPLSKAGVGELIESIQEQSRQTILQLNDQNGQLERRIAKLTEEIEAQEQRLVELQEASATSKAEGAAALANLETIFNKNQTQRDVDFSDLLQRATNDLATTKKEFSDSANSAIDALEKHKSDAARIVQVVGDIGVTGNYQTIANTEAHQANLWRLITVGLFACGLAMAGFTFYKFYHEPVSTNNPLAIAVRLLYALAVASPAFYTARESARHRTNADRARQTELELASLGPFIELLKDDDKDDIRKSLISTYFGRHVDAHEVRTILDSGSKA
jgi:hypothetical protein